MFGGWIVGCSVCQGCEVVGGLRHGPGQVLDLDVRGGISLSTKRLAPFEAN